ncbi:MAG TPA: anti-sigma factor [Gaiellaceae bacterium]
MEADLHDLTAAYSLDALDPEDARAYEAHLARCDRCRAELAELTAAATALAFAAPAPAPSPELRARILREAGRERSNVVPLRARWATPVTAIAAVAACAAVGLGIWAASLSGKLDRREAALSRQDRVARIVASPGSRRVAFSQGTLVVTSAGEAALLLRNLAQPGSGRTYEAWVADGGAPRPAGLFKGGDVVAVPLEQPVGKAATVMVTREKAGGTNAPTQTPFVVVRSSAQS